MDFDGHIVTIESCGLIESAPSASSIPQPQPQHQPQHHLPPPPPPPVVLQQPIAPPIQRMTPKFKPPAKQMIPKKRTIQPDIDDDDLEEDPMEICQEPSIPVPVSSNASTAPPQSSLPEPVMSEQPTLPQPVVQELPVQEQPLSPQVPSHQPTPVSPFSHQKRVRVGLSKRVASTLHQSTHSNISSAKNIQTNNAYKPVAQPNVNNSNNTSSSSHVQAAAPVAAVAQPVVTAVASSRYVRSTNNTDTLLTHTSNGTSLFSPASKLPVNEPTAADGEADITKPFKSPFAEGK